jgi:hypothetical protein
VGRALTRRFNHVLACGVRFASGNLVVVLALVACACGGGGKQLPRDRVVEPGTALFNGYTHKSVDCWECHDGEGGGTKWGPALATRVGKLTDAELRRVIVDGRGKMPAFRARLSDAELATLVGWLRQRFDRAAAAKAGPVVVDPCDSDDDCVVTNFPGCCACPECAPPTARSREGARRAEAVCATTTCPANVCAEPCPHETADHFVARCRDRACTAERR